MCKEWHPYFHLVFRLLVGIMFFLHGAAKFGWLGGEAVTGGLMVAAGVIELAVGAAVVLGLWVEWASLLAVTMLVAYFYAHAGAGWNPLDNGGELALLYFAAFLVLHQHGAGKWTLMKSKK